MDPSPNLLPRTVAASLARLGDVRGSLVLVAVSGGSDSVALLHTLVGLQKRFGYRLAAAHLNHRLRGEESDRDEAFVRRLCERLHVELLVEQAAGLDPSMPNLEERAREERLAFLSRAAETSGAKYVAVAHHANDQAETVLMRLLRGAGAAGLSAMSEAGPWKIIRPMLALERRDILAYLSGIGADYVDDSSNASRAPLRNRIRHELLPSLERDYAPGAARRLAAVASELRTIDSFVTREAARELATMRGADGALNLTRFAALDPALRAPAIRVLLRETVGNLRSIGRVHIDAVLTLATEGPPNGEVVLPGGIRVHRAYDLLTIQPILRPVEPAQFEVDILLDGVTEVSAADVEFEARVIGVDSAAMPEDLDSALFDLGAFGGAKLVARNYLQGDRVKPLGVDGTRKLTDVFIDRKVPRDRRAIWPVVVLGGEVVWVPGLVRSCHALIGSGTEKVLQVEARELGPEAA